MEQEKMENILIFFHCNQHDFLDALNPECGVAVVSHQFRFMYSLIYICRSLLNYNGYHGRFNMHLYLDKIYGYVFTTDKGLG